MFIRFCKRYKTMQRKQGIRATLVIVYFKMEHTLVAFETIDRGLIFIELQADKEVKVKIGIRY